jgi:hypothetical protein
MTMQGLLNLSNETEAKLTTEAQRQGKLTVELAEELIEAGLSVL